jgi:oxygen-independent coproporphyrinogen-3 oxidase
VLDGLKDNSFSLYVSIPFCPTRCSYCSFVSQSVEQCLGQIPEYLDNLCKEIEYTAKLVSRLGLVLDTVYFGGGTPTTLEADQLERLMKTIANSFDLSQLREYTVEAGRPDTITKQKLEAIKRNGCTRVSINPQTLSDSVLEKIGRKHTTEQFFKAFELAREVGFDSINTDIIAGLPSDTPESFAYTVDKLIQLGAENITVHTLSIKRAARLNRDREEGLLENPADKMVGYATKRLLESGYVPYYLYRQKNMLENLENIGWSKPGKESLYNVYIMEEVQTILAVGAGGSTKLVDTKNKRLERVFNYKFPLEYNRHFDLMLEKKKETEDFYAHKE